MRRFLAKTDHGSKTKLLEWLNAREAAKFGTALADHFVRQPVFVNGASQEEQDRTTQEFLRRASGEARTLNLNFYKRAKFAYSFKWRLLENGVAKDLANEVTERLLLHLSLNQVDSAYNPDAAPTGHVQSNSAKYLLTQGNKCFTRGAYAGAITFYQELVEKNPRHAVGLNNLGAAYCKLGRYQEAEKRFRESIAINANYAEAHGNLGNVFRSRGEIAEAEIWLRRAVKLKPIYVDARINLGLALVFLGRLEEANAQFAKALKVAPRNADAMYGVGQIAAINGQFDEAEAMFKRALEINPKLPSALAGLVDIRRVSSVDLPWLESAVDIAESSMAPLDEVDLRFAIGKFCDDAGDFKRAYENYKRANDLLKSLAEDYDRDGRARFVDDLIRTYTRGVIFGAKPGASASMKPVLVVGMPRAGTSLTEQIIASHPSAKGAGELRFWSEALREHETIIRQGLLSESARGKMGEAYLRVLEASAGDAKRIVDKATVNSDYLGIIHSIFPNARIIYMQRDPIDTCLSCYFQKFALSLNFTMDLSDLAHYYQEHRRLMDHWHTVLPPGTILDVPYAELVADQEGWSRKILNFLDLDWDERCLDFHTTKRPVVTSSFWQVRQRIYKNSLHRWRNYKKFIAPLLPLKDSGT